jgi:hypothetical protein
MSDFPVESTFEAVYTTDYALCKSLPFSDLLKYNLLDIRKQNIKEP